MSANSSIEWTGRRLGALKTAASRVGLSLAKYKAKLAVGLKWCTGCKGWHSQSEFVRDRSRGDGYRARCLKADHGRPRGPRDPMREEARRAVAVAVRYRRLAHPASIPCYDCNHVGEDRRHEYDHYLGYAEQNRLDVQAVCTLCHADREKARRLVRG